MNLYIVEDSALIQSRLIRFAEEIPGVRVVGLAGDADLAYSHLQAQSVDVVIIDLHLAAGSGMQLLQKIKHSQPHIKAMVLTNHATEGNRLHAERDGADVFLDKSTAFDRIQQYLQIWQYQPTANCALNHSTLRSNP